MKKELNGYQGEIEPNDRVLYEGHLTLVQRPHIDKDYDVIVSKNAVVMLYIDEEDCVHFAKEYRPAMNRMSLALPAGLMDKPDDNPLERIVGELEEECGVRLPKSQVKYIGTVDSSPGHDTEMVHLFKGRGKGEYVGQKLDEHEKIEPVRIPFETAYQMMLDNKLEGTKTWNLLQHEYIERLEKKLKLYELQ